MFIQYLFTNSQYFASWIIIIIFSVCFHEFFHALVAYHQGDPTAKDEGYFTFNPAKYMNETAIICLF